MMISLLGFTAPVCRAMTFRSMPFPAQEPFIEKLSYCASKPRPFSFCRSQADAAAQLSVSTNRV